MRLVQLSNPPNPFETRHAEWLEPPPLVKVQVYEETARSILSHNDSPDIPFTWSINPYRGCQHACAYCYARRTHEYLGWGAGTDFDTRIVAKVNAPELLRKAFSSAKWKGESISFSGVTDCYQPIEASYELTRRCLEVCREFENPVGIITKGVLIVRDIELLVDISKRCLVGLWLSIPTIDSDIARLLEPQAPAPQRRLDAMRRLCDAGLSVGVMVAPIIPGLTDDGFAAVLEAAANAGASTAGMTSLRLPGSVEPVFLERLREAMPLRAERVINRIRAMHGGALFDSRFGKRMSGEGAHWEATVQLFDAMRSKYGFDRKDEPQGTGGEAVEPLARTRGPRPKGPMLWEEVDSETWAIKRRDESSASDS